MKLRRILLLAVLACTPAACGLSDPLGARVERDGNRVEGVGRVEVAPLQSSITIWGIYGADRRWYFPLDGMPEAFQERGLRVRFEGRLRSDVLALMAMGELIELNTLQRD